MNAYLLSIPHGLKNVLHLYTDTYYLVKQAIFHLKHQFTIICSENLQIPETRNSPDRFPSIRRMQYIKVKRSPNMRYLLSDIIWALLLISRKLSYAALRHWNRKQLVNHIDIIYFIWYIIELAMLIYITTQFNKG